MEIKTLSPTASNLSDTERSENVRGAAWMTASMFGYVVNDAFIKRAAEDLPLFQAVFLRGLVVVVLLTTIVRMRKVTVPVTAYLERPVLLRMAMEAAGTVAYLITLTPFPYPPLTLPTIPSV